MNNFENYKLASVTDSKAERTSEHNCGTDFSAVNSICASIQQCFRGNKKYDGFNNLCILKRHLEELSDASISLDAIIQIIDENELVSVLMDNILHGDGFMKVREISLYLSVLLSNKVHSIYKRFIDCDFFVQISKQRNMNNFDYVIGLCSNILYCCYLDKGADIADKGNLFEALMTIFPIENIRDDLRNADDSELVHSYLALLGNYTLFKLDPEIYKQIICVSHDFLQYDITSSIICLNIYENILKNSERGPNIMEYGFDFQMINELLFGSDKKVIEKSLSLISIIYQRYENVFSFNIGRIIEFILDENYDIKISTNASYALRKILENESEVSKLINTTLFINHLLDNFESFEFNVKINVGFSLCSSIMLTDHINIARYIENSVSFFEIARIILDLQNYQLTLAIFQSFTHIFELSKNREKLYNRLVEKFMDSFPDDSIWKYINVNSKEIEEIGINFLHEYFNVIE